MITTSVIHGSTYMNLKLANASIIPTTPVSRLFSTANTNLNGTGTIATVITGASNGTRVKTVTIKAIGTITKGLVRLFIEDNVPTNTDLVA